MELPDDEARALYSDPSVHAYQREVVRANMLDWGEMIEAYCYNLPAATGLSETNPTYAAKLSELVRALHFDSAYADEIAAFDP